MDTTRCEIEARIAELGLHSLWVGSSLQRCDIAAHPMGFHQPPRGDWSSRWFSFCPPSELLVPTNCAPPRLTRFESPEDSQSATRSSSTNPANCTTIPIPPTRLNLAPAHASRGARHSSRNQPAFGSHVIVICGILPRDTRIVFLQVNTTASNPMPASPMHRHVEQPILTVQRRTHAHRFQNIASSPTASRYATQSSKSARTRCETHPAHASPRYGLHRKHRNAISKPMHPRMHQTIQTARRPSGHPPRAERQPVDHVVDIILARTLALAWRGHRVLRSIAQPVQSRTARSLCEASHTDSARKGITHPSSDWANKSRGRQWSGHDPIKACWQPIHKFARFSAPATQLSALHMSGKGRSRCISNKTRGFHSHKIRHGFGNQSVAQVEIESLPYGPSPVLMDLFVATFARIAVGVQLHAALNHNPIDINREVCFRQ